MGRKPDTVAGGGKNTRIQSLIDRLAVEGVQKVHRKPEKPENPGVDYPRDTARRIGQFYPRVMGRMAGTDAGLTEVTNLIADSLDLKLRDVCKLLNRRYGALPVSYDMVSKLRYRLKS